MGSCVSFSRSPPPASSSTAAGELARRQRAVVATSKVVNLDGSMAQFAGPVTAREALLELAPGQARFLCISDELGFDVPARALAAGEALRPGQLYFALPAPMLRRPLSGDDMAALAVRAATALAVEAGLAAGGLSPQRRTKKGEAAPGNGRHRRRQSTARVAPLLVASGKDDGLSDDGSWSSDMRGGLATRRTGHDGDRTAGKARAGRGAAHRSGGARRHRPGVQQRLSAIAEDEE
ncbi:uncharacterized protein LOC120661103 [Panicum virgatum]|uniref:Uncharacterized protein n=1 Tax=Panicum virgatum TaxID=38727 RepID=A0A8T0VN94_PANVG|nr:uncharacterized protein LOC120661103 [Panicum virgatum]KAG2635897.1 hypothetical protein PVAP13_2NG404800 [Panicum virgatum]